MKYSKEAFVKAILHGCVDSYFDNVLNGLSTFVNVLAEGR